MKEKIKKFTCPHCKKTGENKLKIKINYCPYCGKKIHSSDDKNSN